MSACVVPGTPLTFVISPVSSYGWPTALASHMRSNRKKQTISQGSPRECLAYVRSAPGPRQARTQGRGSRHAVVATKRRAELTDPSPPGRRIQTKTNVYSVQTRSDHFSTPTSMARNIGGAEITTGPIRGSDPFSAVVFPPTGTGELYWSAYWGQRFQPPSAFSHDDAIVASPWQS